ncbi:MAG: methyltransferase domain-containing protein [Gammaproteobacteria bacterium]|nr:methyltransferase domain-containing protein [Gammaproteobacteria bacterium]
MDWDERYSEPGYAYGEIPNDFLVSCIEAITGKQVLSLAEGEGRNAVYLAKNGFDVTAVDASSVGLEKANALAGKHQVSINTEQADLAAYEPGIEQWDAVVSIFCHLPEVIRGALHRKVIQSLRPGGVLILEAYIPRQLDFATGGPGDVSLMMSLEKLTAELQGLSFEVAQEIERDVIEGKYHHGRAAVVQILARKT